MAVPCCRKSCMQCQLELSLQFPLWDIVRCLWLVRLPWRSSGYGWAAAWTLHLLGSSWSSAAQWLTWMCYPGSCTWRMAKQHGPKCLILRLSPRLRCRRWLRSATGLRSWMPCPAPLMRWPRSTAWRWLCSNVLNRCLTSTPLQSAIGAELGLKHRAATSCRWSANLPLRMLRRSHPSLWAPTWREVLRHQPCPQQILSLVLSKSTYRSQSGKVSCRQLLETEWSALSILARRGHIGQPKRHGHQRLRRFWLQAQSSKVPGSWPAMTFWSSWATRTASTSPFWPIPSRRRC